MRSDNELDTAGKSSSFSPAQPGNAAGEWWWWCVRVSGCVRTTWTCAMYRIHTHVCMHVCVVCVLGGGGIGGNLIPSLIHIRGGVDRMSASDYPVITGIAPRWRVKTHFPPNNLNKSVRK